MMLLLSLFSSLAFAANPVDGHTYRGEENVLGIDVVATMGFDLAGNTNFTITGPLTIKCPAEPYTMSGNNIDLTNAGTAGDCVHDALAQEKVTLNSIVYDPSANDITVSVKYSFFNLKLTLTQQSFGGAACGSDCETNAEAGKVDRWALADPAGTYHGSKTILGMSIDATVVDVDSTHMNMKITGAADVDCTNEVYHYSNGVVTLDGLNTDGDCIHDAMQDAGVKLEEITYDSDKDMITVKVKKLFITASLELSHVSSELIAPAKPFKILTTKINPAYLEKLKASRAEEN